MKVSKLEGALLDVWIAKALDYDVVKAKGNYFRVFDNEGDPVGRIDAHTPNCYTNLSWSTNWEQGGLIIEREEIDIRRNWPALNRCGGDLSRKWFAEIIDPDKDYRIAYGPTPLIAAMRCFVASKFGDEVELPEQLESK